MAPKSRWRDNPDLFKVRPRCEELILQYLEWMCDNESTIDETIDLCEELGEALISLGEIMGITVHIDEAAEIYAAEVAATLNKTHTE